MSFKDILKKSFLENYAGGQIDVSTIALALVITCLLAIYIYFFYRIITKKSFYSKSFNISLAALAIITAAIILTIQTSVVVSLGMVGALSIVRFRTAIKDPMDLVFLFWSISIGIICGAGIFGLAVAVSIAVTVVILVLDKIPQAKAPQILLVSYIGGRKSDDAVDSIISDHANYFKEKSRTIVNGQTSVAYELRISEGKELCESLSDLEGVSSVSLLKHDGEVTY
ncbi:MAG: DUF4956 domain-containing protein [Butyrivibrio sp.]|nr:DUF4956 domain-containing protein [Butyrivibrio sp.]